MKNKKQTLSAVLVRKEGGKSQGKMADSLQQMSILSDLIYEDPATIFTILYKAGEKRAKKKKK